MHIVLVLFLGFEISVSEAVVGAAAFGNIFHPCEFSVCQFSSAQKHRSLLRNYMILLVYVSFLLRFCQLNNYGPETMILSALTTAASLT